MQRDDFENSAKIIEEVGAGPSGVGSEGAKKEPSFLLLSSQRGDSIKEKKKKGVLGCLKY